MRVVSPFSHAVLRIWLILSLNNRWLNETRGSSVYNSCIIGYNYTPTNTVRGLGIRSCKDKGDMKFKIMAAMCVTNRGIGFNNSLPWPKLPNEYRYFMDLTSKTSSPDRKCVNIRGRVTWQCASNEGKTRDVFNIVISRNPSKDIKNDKLIHKIVSSLDGALQYVETSLKDQVETIWILGGQYVYTDAVSHQSCDRLYLTHIQGLHTADTYFPPFEDSFDEDMSADLDRTLQKENNVTYEFKVYTPRRLKIS
ncbi:dihydrofolate reductase-like [Pecten maximus]|uniref:dihydrofolate reductase-like n=1 Tax=Pecten maximus TaxID=6579 RepID=UPI00145909E0|nr:dihydrofolate reductase-like [Pecten maximus]